MASPSEEFKYLFDDFFFFLNLFQTTRASFVDQFLVTYRVGSRFKISIKKWQNLFRMHYKNRFDFRFSLFRARYNDIIYSLQSCIFNHGHSRWPNLPVVFREQLLNAEWNDVIILVFQQMSVKWNKHNEKKNIISFDSVSPSFCSSATR